jgi:fumarate reductase subunit C
VTEAAEPPTYPPAALRGEEQETATYRPRLGVGWWARHRHYLLYMVREFTPIPFGAWLLWFLVEISRLKNGPDGYAPHMSTGFVVFSVVVLFFALWHSVTFLSLSGLIVRLPLGQRVLTGRPIAGLFFAGWLAVSVVVGFFLVWLGHS